MQEVFGKEKAMEFYTQCLFWCPCGCLQVPNPAKTGGDWNRGSPIGDSGRGSSRFCPILSDLSRFCPIFTGVLQTLENKAPILFNFAPILSDLALLQIRQNQPTPFGNFRWKCGARESWRVTECRAKSWEVMQSRGKSWKIIENLLKDFSPALF